MDMCPEGFRGTAISFLHAANDFLHLLLEDHPPGLGLEIGHLAAYRNIMNSFAHNEVNNFTMFFPSLLVTLFFGDPNGSNGTSRPT